MSKIIKLIQYVEVDQDTFVDDVLNAWTDVVDIMDWETSGFTAEMDPEGLHDQDYSSILNRAERWAELRELDQDTDLE